MPYWGPTEQALRDFLGKMDRSAINSNGMPQVRHAPPFRQEPLVVGRPETARLVDSILQIAPELRGHINKIVVGPTEGAVRVLAKSKISPYDYDRTNLLGTQSPDTHDISLNPKLEDKAYNKTLLSTLIHELSHSRGYGEAKAYSIDQNIPQSLLQDRSESTMAHYDSGLMRNSRNR